MEGPARGRCSQKPKSHRNNSLLVCLRPAGASSEPFRGRGWGRHIKAPFFPGKQRGAGCRQLPEEPAHSTRGTALLGLAAPGPACCATPGTDGHCVAAPASCALDAASPPPPGASAAAQQVWSLPSRCCTNSGQVGTPGTKSVPGQSRARRCAGGARAGSSTAGDGAFPARGIRHRAQPRLRAQDVAPVGADTLC